MELASWTLRSWLNILNNADREEGGFDGGVSSQMKRKSLDLRKIRIDSNEENFLKI